MGLINSLPNIVNGASNLNLAYLKMIGKNSIRIYDEFGLKKADELVRKIDHELKELE